MAGQWYYAKGNDKHGPVSGRELKQLATKGELVPTDMVWRTGMEDWQPANSVTGLFDESSAGVAPPLPPQPDSPTLPDQPSISNAAKGLFAAVSSKASDLGAAAIDAVKKLQDSTSSTADAADPPAPSDSSESHSPSTSTPVPKRTILIGAGGCLAVLLVMAACGGILSIFNGNGGRKVEGQGDYTVDEFRAKIVGEDYRPKSDFYNQFGKPYRTLDIGQHTYLYYYCEDGAVSVKCPKGPFHYQDTIAPLSVKQDF
jgi:hypothetical protein